MSLDSARIGTKIAPQIPLDLNVTEKRKQLLSASGLGEAAMWKRLMKGIGILITGILIFQMVGCGTILYPERRGQRAGRIDPGVAILDGVGLLLFVIPGVIAFAVDFATGTIYLPGTARASLNTGEVRQVAFDPEHTSMEDIERIIQRETGCEVDLSRSDVEISRLQSPENLRTHFASALPQMENSKPAVASLL